MDIWQTFLAAFALMLVFEGLLPFSSPNAFREYARRLAELDDRVLRGFGLVAMLTGAGILYLLKSG